MAGRGEDQSFQRLTDYLKISDSLEAPKWEERYCVLAMEQRRLYFFADAEGMEMVPLSPDKSYSQDDSSVPARAVTDAEVPFKRGTNLSRSFNMKTLRTSFRGKRVKTEKDLKVERAEKSRSLKMERTRSVGKGEGEKVHQVLSQQRRLGQSLDSLDKLEDLSPTVLGEPNSWLDMSVHNIVSIHAMHASISPKHSCFRILTRQVTLYVSCGSEEDLQKWLKQQPQKELYNRVDTRLSISFQEARNVPSKKWYFCDISINGLLYAQTCCKQKGDILFWGEQFLFEHLPIVETIQIKLYKESQTKRKKDKSNVVELGIIDLPVHQLNGGAEMEKWHTLIVNQTSQGKGLISTRDNPAIRIKASLQSVSVMPHKAYSEFQEYLTKEYKHLVRVLEPAVSARWKDEIAQTLLRTLQVTGEAKEFLVDVVMSEVSHMDNENLVFRGNTFATKAVDTYMKMVGEKYLRNTLGDIINRILESDADFEVDPMKLSSSGNLHNNQKTLQLLVQKTWSAITESHRELPSDLRKTFALIRQKFGPQREEVCFRLISGSIFLRFFCPAILSPSLFHLCQEYPDERTYRKLTLVAKVIQSLANFTRFGVKEEYMCFMNGFVELEIPSMKQFLQRISSPITPLDKVVPWGPHRIDLGRELSIMHTILTDQMKKLGESVCSRLPRLNQVLDNVRKTTEVSGRNLIDDALQSLRQLDTNATGEGVSPSNSDQELSSSLTSGDFPYMLGRLGDMGTDGKKIAIKGGESPSPVSSSAGTTPVKHGAYRPFGSVTTPVKERPGLYRSSVPNLAADLPPSADRHTLSPQRVIKPAAARGHSMSVDLGSSKVDPNSDNDIDRLRQELLSERLKRKTCEKEVGVLKMELSRSEETKKQLDLDLQTLSRGKGDRVNNLLGVLNRTASTYKTEKSLASPQNAQLRKELEDLKDALKRKDDIIKEQQKRIASLVEANKTLSEGLNQLHRINCDLSGSESDDDDSVGKIVRGSATLTSRPSALNGQSNGSPYRHPKEPTTPSSQELWKVMKGLDKGHFDFET